MFGRLSSCFRRHRKKLFFFGGILGIFAILNAYFKRKFLEFESKQAQEYGERLRRTRHFDGAMSTCDGALVSFAPKVREIICTTINVDPIVKELKENPSNKLELWKQLKVLVFSQAIGEMYTQCLLAVLLRVQISILSGYTYSKQNTSEDQSSLNTKPDEYMSVVLDFMVSGIRNLLIPVKNVVDEILEGIPLDRTLKLGDVEDMLSCIKNSLTLEILPNVSQYLIDHKIHESCDEFLQTVLNETKDVLECEDFSSVLLQSIDRGTAALMDRASECYAVLSCNGKNFVNPNDYAVPLAKVIPTMHNVFSQHSPDEQGSLVYVLIQQDSLKHFAANIYEAFSQSAV